MHTYGWIDLSSFILQEIMWNVWGNKETGNSQSSSAAGLAVPARDLVEDRPCDHRFPRGALRMCLPVSWRNCCCRRRDRLQTLEGPSEAGARRIDAFLFFDQGGRIL